eukprot:TRINITY_DN11918_c0_g1_i1.p1 TRINITY_DN11918_c0_g1~~TRINITY_DN11918_c0_g1_i1.p1  ORF type:complete len:313 (-),score=39.01 TRINITY_DN11918_c0_g1_i1:51-989(-)
MNSLKGSTISVGSTSKRGAVKLLSTLEEATQHPNFSFLSKSMRDKNMTLSLFDDDSVEQSSSSDSSSDSSGDENSTEDPCWIKDENLQKKTKSHRKKSYSTIKRGKRPQSENIGTSNKNSIGPPASSPRHTRNRSLSDASIDLKNEKKSRSEEKTVPKIEKLNLCFPSLLPRDRKAHSARERKIKSDSDNESEPEESQYASVFGTQRDSNINVQAKKKKISKSKLRKTFKTDKSKIDKSTIDKERLEIMQTLNDLFDEDVFGNGNDSIHQMITSPQLDSRKTKPSKPSSPSKLMNSVLAKHLKSDSKYRKCK